MWGMTRCTACSGSMIAEPVERLFQRDGATTELRCLSCGLGPGPEQASAPRWLCSVPGCLKARTSTGELCAGHRAVVTRRERMVVG